MKKGKKSGKKKSSKLKGTKLCSATKKSKNEVPIFEEFNNASEKGPFISIRSLFPADYQFPPAETMEEEQLSKKLDEIYDTLFAHNIELDFNDNVPDKLVYTYLISKVIPEENIIEDKYEGCFTHLTGCDGACDICFQKKYCDEEMEEMEKS